MIDLGWVDDGVIATSENRGQSDSALRDRMRQLVDFSQR